MQRLLAQALCRCFEVLVAFATVQIAVALSTLL